MLYNRLVLTSLQHSTARRKVVLRDASVEAALLKPDAVFWCNGFTCFNFKGRTNNSVRLCSAWPISKAVIYVAFVLFYILIKEHEHPRSWSAALYSWGLSRLNCSNGYCKLLEVMKPNAVIVSFLKSLLFTGCLLEVKGKHGMRIWCSCHVQRLKCLERC